MEEIAQVYSQSLFQVAKEQGKLDEVREQLGQFADALGESRELQTYFFSPYFSPKEKREGLARAIDGADPVVTNFLGLLAEKHRMPAVFRIRRELDRLWEQENRLLPIQITTAVELDAATTDRIVNAIAEQTGRRVDPKTTVDPDIVGGIVLRVGNSVLDASIRNRLDQLRREVAKA